MFALANAGIPLSREALSAAVSSSVTLGVFFGLVIGKMVGVFGASMIAAKIGIAKLPRGVTTMQMLGIAAGAGIGFTVAIFVTGISLTDVAVQDEAKIGIFAASFVAALLSVVLLSIAHKRVPPDAQALEDLDDEQIFAEEPVPHIVPS